MRKDLKMRRGKEIAQGSHASMAWIANKLRDANYFENAPLQNRVGVSPIFLSDAEKEWMTGIFTKICLQVDSEDELMDIHNAALRAGLKSSLIIDAGKTEFNGVPTPTCIGIGPDDDTEINKITGHLKLY